jgi:hypothetical protein
MVGGKIIRIFNQDPSSWIDEEGLGDFIERITKELAQMTQTLTKVKQLYMIAERDS